MCLALQVKFKLKIYRQYKIHLNKRSLINEPASLFIATLNGFKKLLKLPAIPSSS